MSGGAFEYASRTIPTDLGEIVQEKIVRMLRWLKDQKNNPEAIELMEDFLSQAARLADEATRLSDVLHAIEWWASGDSGPAALDKAVQALEPKRAKSEQDVRVVVGEDGKTECGYCGARDYPLEKHRCD